MKFCRLENYSCQEKTPTSDLTARLAPIPTCSLSHKACMLSFPLIQNMWDMNFQKLGWEILSLLRATTHFPYIYYLFFLNKTFSGRNKVKSYRTQLFCFSITEQLYFLFALKFSWTVASKRHIHCCSMTVINISSPIPSSKERGINQLSVLLYLWLNEWKSHCSL